MAPAGSEVANTLLNAVTSFERRKEWVWENRLLTDLDKLVPSGADDDGVLRIGTEPDTRHPLRVALISDGKLAIAEGVPQFDGAVTRPRDDLTIVGGERNGQDVICMSDEATSRSTGCQFPEAESLVPRSGEGVGAVRGDDLGRVGQS